MLWTWLTQSRLWLCRCAYVCACAHLPLCMCVSIQRQQLHSISLLRQHSRRSSGSNTHTNQTQRCVGGHFELTVSRAWAAAEKMSRHHFRGRPCYTWGPPGWLSPLSSTLQELLYKKKEIAKSRQAASDTERWSKGREKTYEEEGKSKNWYQYCGNKSCTRLIICFYKCEKKRKKKCASVCERAAEGQGCVSPPVEGETSWPYTSVSLISSVFKKGWSGHLPVISWLCQGCVCVCTCVWV